MWPVSRVAIGADTAYVDDCIGWYGDFLFFECERLWYVSNDFRDVDYWWYKSESFVDGCANYAVLDAIEIYFVGPF